MPELSVIIPTYNRASLMAECVASVRACGVDAEIVVVDDGSTDDTEERANKLGVTFVRQANAGPAAARNNGAARSSGEFLAFLDSDDAWRPGVVGRLIDALTNHPEADVAFADALVGSPEDGFTTSIMALLGGPEFAALPSRLQEPGVRILDRGAFFRRLIQRNQVFLGSAVIRRSAFDAAGGFDPEMFGAEDYELILRLACRGRFAYVAEPLALYRKHPGTVSADPDRMAREFALATRKVLAKCPDLPTEERRLLRRRRREILYFLGYNSYDRGEFAEARKRFRGLFREFGPDPVSLAVWGACLLPARVVHGLRRVKRSVAGGRT